MKKLLAMLLCLVMVLSLFAACGGDTDKDSDGDKTGDTNKITIGIPQDMAVLNYDDNAYTKWLEEESGYDIEFVMYATNAGDYKSQLATAVLNEKEELPDILWGFKGLGDGVWARYFEDEYFIDLTDYMMDKEGKAKEWWDRAAKLDPGYVDMIIRRCSTDDGRVVAFPRVEYTEIDTMDYMVFINQEWLTKLNLDMPTDRDSFYNVLKAFKSNDLTGNGDTKDERPLVGLDSNAVNWLINMFIYNDTEKLFGLSEDGKTITTPFTSDKYREALKFIRKLVDEGLMENPYSVKGTDVTNWLNPQDGQPATVGIALGHPTLEFMYGNETVKQYAAMPYWGCAARNENQNTRGTFITEDAEDVDACWELLMLMASEESAMRQRYGEYGKDWTDADPGSKSYLGYDATYKILRDDAFSGQNNQTWHDIEATILIGAENEYAQYDETIDPWQHAKNGLIRDIYNNFSKAEKENNPKYIMPVIYYDEDEDLLTENERGNVTSVINSYRMKFISGTGAMDPSSNSDWKIYLGELQDNGLQTWLDQLQRMYTEDGYYAKVMDGTAYT